MKYSSSREYGPYPQTKDVTVSALGKAKGNIPCRDKTIKARDLGNINSATLEFDDEEISDYIEEKKRKKIV